MNAGSELLLDQIKSLPKREKISFYAELTNDIGLSDSTIDKVQEEIGDLIAIQRAEEIQNGVAKTITHDEMFEAIRKRSA